MAVRLQPNGHDGCDLVTHVLTKLLFGGCHCAFKRCQPCEAVCREQHALGASVAWVGFACHQVPRFALGYQVTHGLFRHPGGFCQISQSRAVTWQMPCEVNVCRANLFTGCEVRKCLWHVNVMRHQAQHAGVKAPQRVPHQSPQVAAAPVVGAGRWLVSRHVLIVRQTDH